NQRDRHGNLACPGNESPFGHCRRMRKLPSRHSSVHQQVVTAQVARVFTMFRVLSFGLCAICIAISGCEKKTSINGTVTYNATPIENGYISFSPKKRGRTLASPIKDGQYSIAEATPGKYTAVVIGTRKINHYSTSAEAYANAAKNPHVSEAADYIA